ncbi:XRE family transcriptional regulator [Lactobacillus taiwanensis]|uniref:helix-turn-helix domain-containing protein n=1 Tax=Lactobacillus taiwanensis TaxID=508451 RepID=UPI000B995CD2|nr:helix-turn-helix transcriptional regulator [Lactobacillus taiwanensis]OYS00301.1 XRE family transcriptional regulator [Lactobacillus taiwanensis]OYS03742.1 XRE family transcriptional regulator [Lactobacillus taiwanensis]
MQTRLKELRKEIGLTQEELGEQVGLANNTISRYETGSHEPTKFETWQKLADFFNVPVDYLLGISEDRSTLTIDDLNPEEQEAYERITDMLSQEYPQTRPAFNWSKIGQLLINSDLTEE